MAPQEAKLAKGVLLVDTVEFLRSKKGEPAVTKLEKTCGSLLFDNYRMYPLEDLLSLQKQVITALYGKETDEGYKALGVDAFRTFTNSIVGATLTNIAHSPKELLQKIQELWSSVLNFGSRKLIKLDESTHYALIEIKDDPRPPAYLQGVIEASFKSIGIKAITKTKSDHESAYTIEITWSG